MPLPLTIPFAGPAGHESGPMRDGMLLGSLPRVDFSGVLSASRSSAAAAVLRGDVVSGSILYRDYTTEAESDAPSDVPFLNGTSPAADELLIGVSGVVEGIGLLVGRAGAGAGVAGVSGSGGAANGGAGGAGANGRGGGGGGAQEGGSDGLAAGQSPGGRGGDGVVVIRFATRTRTYRALRAFADDTTARTGGLLVGQFYRDSSSGAVRQVA